MATECSKRSCPELMLWQFALRIAALVLVEVLCLGSNFNRHVDYIIFLPAIKKFGVYITAREGGHVADDFKILGNRLYF